MAAQPPLTLRVGEVLDRGPWSGARKRVCLLMGVAVVCDGFESALVGVLAPNISASLGVPLTSVAVIFAAGLAGMIIGAIIGGLVGDRIGRRWAVIGCILLFSLPTMLVAQVDNLHTLALLRVAVGMGLGGLLPGVSAMVAEFTTARIRSGVVMLTMMCIAVGSILAALSTTVLLDRNGWRPLFVLAGGAPALFAFLLIFVLPESPRFRFAREGASVRLRALFCAMRIAVPADVRVEDDGHSPRPTLRSLFGRAYRLDFAMLAAAFFFSMLCNYSFNSWLPTVVAAMGIGGNSLGIMVAMYYCGSVIGIPIGALLLSRLGSRRLLVS